jgi:NHL repeat
VRILLAAPAVAALCLSAGASEVSGNGTIYTVAGTGAAGFSGDGGKAASAALNTPAGLAVDGAGNLYIADTGNHRIRKVSPAGVITTIAGTGSGGFSGDGGPATAAQLFSPVGIALDGRGGLYVADLGNNRVRRIAPDGTTSTVAGNGVDDQTEDGVPATEAALNRPSQVAVDGAGTLHVGERDRVIRIPGDGSIHTLAGLRQRVEPRQHPGLIGLDLRPAGARGRRRGQRLHRRPRQPPRPQGPPGRDHHHHRGRGVEQEAVRSRHQGRPRGRGRRRPGGNVYFADASRNRVEKISDLTAEVGTVARAWVSASRTGSAARRLSNELPAIWAHFVFAEQPAAGLPIVVEFHGPHGKLGAIQKPHAQRIDAVLRRQRANTVFAPGKWRALVRVAGKPLKTVSFTVAPFDIK